MYHSCRLSTLHLTRLQSYDPRIEKRKAEVNMEHMISTMLASYERGKVSRRQLVQGLAALTAATGAARGTESTFKGTALNHIAIRVTNVQRSRDFYQKHFGLPVMHEEKDNCFLGLGKNFLTLFENQK